MNCNTFASIVNKVQGNVLSNASAFPTVAGGSTRAVVGVRSDISGGLFDGVPFRVRGVWKAVPGTSGNYTASIYWNKGDNTDLTTFTNDKIFLTSGAIALGTQAASTFVLSAVLVWDSSAQRLAGVNDPQSFHTIATPAVLFSGASAVTATNSPVVSSGLTAVSQLQFFASGLFGTSNAANAATLVELSLEQI